MSDNNIFIRSCSHRLVVLGAFLAVGTAGCIPFSSHRGADLSKLDAFKIEKNKTTESELTQQFGQPTNTTVRSDGSRVLIWSSGSMKMSVNLATALVPIPGVADSRSRVESKTLMATISNGVVIDYTINSGNQEH